jgi:hypothetical protein
MIPDVPQIVDLSWLCVSRRATLWNPLLLVFFTIRFRLRTQESQESGDDSSVCQADVQFPRSRSGGVVGAVNAPECRRNLAVARPLVLPNRIDR